MPHRSPAHHVHGSPRHVRPLGLEAVRTTRVYESVVAQLQDLLTSGRLRPGDKLPSERELCRMFQVGRGSIRDALRVLATMGVVRSRHGGGTVVQDLSPDSIVTPLAAMLTRKRALVQELMDVRGIVEPALAARAARNASAEDLDRLRALVRRQEERLRTRELSSREDAEFHAIIARAAGNRVLRSVLDVLLGLLSETRAKVLQGRPRAVRSARAHRQILDALERHDAAAAEEAMRAHIAGVDAFLARKLRKLQEPAPAPDARSGSTRGAGPASRRRTAPRRD